jgi:hypothetical protein
VRSSLNISSPICSKLREQRRVRKLVKMGLYGWVTYRVKKLRAETDCGKVFKMTVNFSR